MGETVVPLLTPRVHKVLVQSLRTLPTLHHIAVNSEQKVISRPTQVLADTGRHLATSTLAAAAHPKACTRIILALRTSIHDLAGTPRRATEADMADMVLRPMEVHLICKVDITLRTIRPIIGKADLGVVVSTDQTNTLDLMAPAQGLEGAMRHLHSIHPTTTDDKEARNQRPPLVSTEPMHRLLEQIHSSMELEDHRQHWEAQDSQVHTTMADTREVAEEDPWQEDKDLPTQEVE